MSVRGELVGSLESGMDQTSGQEMRSAHTGLQQASQEPSEDVRERRGVEHQHGKGGARDHDFGPKV